MIQIYKPGNTGFKKNGDMVLFPEIARVHAILNGEWTAELEHTRDTEGRWKYITDNAVVKMPSFNGEQLLRIKKKEKTEHGIKAEMLPIFMDAKEDCFLLDVRPTEKNGQQALALMTASNGKYTATSNISKKTTAYYETKNLIEAIGGDDENSFLNRWGGEILFDNFKIVIDEQVGGDYGKEIRYGKNIKQDGISEEIDMRDVVTRIIPKAYNGRMIEGNEPWVDSPLIDKYPTIKYGVMKFEDIKMRVDVKEGDEKDGIIICDTTEQLKEELKKKCEEQFENGVDKPKITLKIDIVMLKGTDLYKDFEELEKVGLGDTVHCKHAELGIVTDARVIELEYDGILKRVDYVVVGDYKYDYLNDVESTINRVENAIRPDGTVIGESIAGVINGMQAKLKAMKDVAQKQDVRAVLFEDFDPASPTFGAMAIGTAGFEIAGRRTADGREWEWTTFGTAQGFYATYIIAGVLSSRNWVKDKQGFRLNLDDGTINSEYLKLEKGILSIAEAIITGGKFTITNDSGKEIFRVDKSKLQFGEDGKALKYDAETGLLELYKALITGGEIKITDDSGEEIFRANKNGTYAKGSYRSVGKNGSTVVSDGRMSLQNAAGETVGIIGNHNDGATMQSYGSGGGASVTVKSGGIAMVSADDVVQIVGKRMTVNLKEAKTGRLEFSDGTYIDLENGVIVGGSTKEGDF